MMIFAVPTLCCGRCGWMLATRHDRGEVPAGQAIVSCVNSECPDHDQPARVSYPVVTPFNP